MRPEMSAALRVLAAFALYRTPARVRDALLERHTLENEIAQLDAAERLSLNDRASQLIGDGISVLAVDDPQFPRELFVRGRALVPALFCRGHIGLLDANKVSVSGARDISNFGIQASTVLADTAKELDLCVVAGHARGVDTVASARMLKRGGSTILVLPEGISEFRLRSEVAEQASQGSLLVISQFEPRQRWMASNAMSRNRVICALGAAVVVVEAGEKGGTLAAGREALKQERTLLVLTNSNGTPPGNRILIAEGGVPIASPTELRQQLVTCPTPGDQGRLL